MSSHIENLGKLVEDMEIKLRNLLSEVYFSSESFTSPRLLARSSLTCIPWQRRKTFWAT